ncbi:MAG: hypothetical protein J6S56_00045 [Bacteroidales bacterium]|nr:hypothetical protein [Bacteroidales bacterium]
MMNEDCPHTYSVRGFVCHPFTTDAFSPNGLKEVAKCVAISWRVIVVVLHRTLSSSECV